MIEQSNPNIVHNTPPQPGLRDRLRAPALRKLSRAAATSLLLLSAGCSSALGNQSEADNPPTTLQPSAPVFDYNPQIIPYKDPETGKPLANPKGNRQIIPKGITLHWWAVDGGGDIGVLANELRHNPSCGGNGCSVQYGVTKTGATYRMMASSTDFAYHAPGANETTFGIEIEGTPDDFDTQGPRFNKKKFEAVVSLTAELVEDFDLPIEGPTTCHDASGIHGHHEYSHCTNPPSGSRDPGDEYTQAVVSAVKTMQ